MADSVSVDTLDADSLAAGADSIMDTDSLPAAALDTVRDDRIQIDTTRRTEPSNDSLRRLTPQDTIPSGETAAGSDQRVRVRADSLSARDGEEGERLQELFGNVFVRQDSTILRSREAVRYLSKDEFLFRGDVVIFERGDTLRSTTVRYDRRSKVGRAFGRVHLSDGDVDVYSTRAIYYSDEKRSVFPDSVLLVDDDRTLRAESGVYYSEQERADFFGEVEVRDPDTYMEADTVVYYRDEERTEARGDVFIDRNPTSQALAERSAGYDSLEARAASDRPDASPDETEAEEPADAGEQTLLWGDQAVNDEQEKTSRVTGRAILLQVRVDSLGEPTDTLLVRSHRLNALRTDTLNRMVAIDSVRIWQQDLSATADSVVYDRFSASGDDDAENDAPSREETRLYRGPMAWFDGSQVSGDTIRVVAKNRSVDTVFVRSNAFASQEDSVSGKVQQLKGRLITAVFRRDSIRQIVAQPNALAIRFLTGSDGEANGAAKTSADRIVLRFAKGDVERVSVLGGTETTYYKQEIVPDPFQLDGFVWTPDRRPEKKDYVTDERVRRRLRPETNPESDSARVAAENAAPATSPSGRDGSRTSEQDSTAPRDTTSRRTSRDVEDIQRSPSSPSDSTTVYVPHE
ncbi:organic solvent tolerance protein OstA [Longibacter salinarum]|uniref:Organic solvent tolerance protein OstA n=1 Tax=Longibacter salinarum TaxID=1850348 RepID=A0A2A8D3T6_9BACT|nr:OstA-like protein [Longibacter salinarum]PEN15298.1 organic solvent tolerance protein OstA [Longibacter salinarum]